MDDLRTYELQEKMNEKNMKRDPLINEVEIDVAGKTIEEVLKEAIELIDTMIPKMEYDYEKPPKELPYEFIRLSKRKRNKST